MKYSGHFGFSLWVTEARAACWVSQHSQSKGSLPHAAEDCVPGKGLSLLWSIRVWEALVVTAMTGNPFNYGAQSKEPWGFSYQAVLQPGNWSCRRHLVPWWALGELQQNTGLGWAAQRSIAAKAWAWLRAVLSGDWWMKANTSRALMNHCDRLSSGTKT